jgi:Protein of unknown function (DUF2971)
VAIRFNFVTACTGNMPERPLTFQLDQDSLFKYCGARGVDILQSLRLKVSPPNQFNDPFEFLPKVDFCIDETAMKRVMTDRDLLRSEWEQSGLQIPFDDFVATMRAMSENVGEHVARARRGFQDLALHRQSDLVDFISKTYALACYSEISDNLLMWSHYTDLHRGIVVGFDLKNSFFSQATNLMPVSYRSDRVSARYGSEGFAFDEHELSVVRVKSLAWSYEREWRQRFELKDCTKVDNADGTPCYYVTIPSDAIASVTFGVRCPPETETIVRELKKQPDLQHLRLRRALLHERDFKLNIVPADDK